MAREYAQVKLAIWADDDFRTLSPRAQHLYFVLLTSPSLSHCGIADWRPGRIAALAGGWSRESVEAAGAELITRLYVVIDDDTEEVLIRSFVRHDGLMKQPKMAVSMANAHAATASSVLRGVIVYELQRLHDEAPELNGWKSEAAADLLGKASIDPSTYPLGGGPSGGPDGFRSGLIKGKSTPNRTPSASGLVNGSPTPAPTPAPTSSNQHHAAASQPDAAAASSGAELVLVAATITPQTVVAAWVDAVRANGVEPTGTQTGRVGRLAKDLLGKNDPDRVLEAAEAAGTQGHAAIDSELIKLAGRPRTPFPAAARTSTTDSKVQAALELAATFADDPAGAA